jgi:tetratricopeptide (TPR) repeat protein
MFLRSFFISSFVAACLLVGPFALMAHGALDEPAGSSTLSPTQPLFPYFLRHPITSVHPSPEDPPVFKKAYMLFRKGLKNGDFIPAVDAFRDLFARYSGAPWGWKSLWFVAEGYHRMGFYPEAVSSWRRLVRVCPDQRLLLMAKAALAEALFIAGRKTESLVVFQEVRQLVIHEGERAWILSRIGDCLMEPGYKSEARSYYRKALSTGASADWFPPETYDNLALLEISEKNFTKAKGFLLQALNIYHGHELYPKWLFLLGEVLAKEGKISKVVVFWERILTDFPESPQANWARIKLATLRLDRRTAAASPPTEIQWKQWLDPRDAIFWSQRSDPVLQRLFLELARTLRINGKAQQALQVLLNCLDGLKISALWPLFINELKLAASISIRTHLSKGAYPKVISVFDEISKRVPEVWQEGSLLARVAVAYEREGFADLASHLYKAAMRLSPKKDERDINLLIGLWRLKVRASPSNSLIPTSMVIEEIWPKGARPQLLSVLHQWIPPRIRAEQWDSFERLLKDIDRGVLSRDSLIWLAQWWWEQGSPQEASQILKEAVIGWIPRKDSFDKDEEAWCLLGDTLRSSGQLEAALEGYKKVLGRPQWGFLEKWAAFQALELAGRLGDTETASRLSKRLWEEDQGELFGGLVRFITGTESRPGRRKGGSAS